MSPRAPVRSAKPNGTARSPISACRRPGFDSVADQSGKSSGTVNRPATERSGGGASSGSGPTRHSASAGGASGASTTSIRSAIVFTGSNSTVVKTPVCRPYGPRAETSFHSPPAANAVEGLAPGAVEGLAPGAVERPAPGGIEGLVPGAVELAL